MVNPWTKCVHSCCATLRRRDGLPRVDDAVLPEARKRSAEEEEARELRAALMASSHGVAADKCVELRAANKALSQRNAELERAADAQRAADADAVRAVVRDELAAF